MTLVRRLAILATSLVLAGAGIAAGAAPASANQVWYQAFERPSADAPCIAPADQTPWQDSYTGQKEWTPSWAQWANDGKGGWVCQRFIEWAKNSYPSAFCVQGSPNEWVDFLGGWALPVTTTVYKDADCAVFLGTSGWDLVYAPAGWDPAALCVAGFGTSEDLFTWGFDVWACKEYN